MKPFTLNQENESASKYHNLRFFQPNFFANSYFTEALDSRLSLGDILVYRMLKFSYACTEPTARLIQACAYAQVINP